MGRKKRKRDHHNDILPPTPPSSITERKDDDDSNPNTNIGVDSTTGDIHTNNYYDELIQQGMERCKPSNWFVDIYSMSKQNNKNRHFDHNDSTATATNPIPVPIQTLVDELNSIKRTLWPTAIKTSRSKNKNRKQKQKTSPSNEFKLARERCNPFERMDH